MINKTNKNKINLQNKNFRYHNIKWARKLENDFGSLLPKN